LLFVAVTAFHARGLRPGYAFLPIDNVDNNLPWRTGPFVLGGLQNPLIGDPIYQFYPFLVTQVEAVRSGHWPLWSSRILLGHPLLGDPLAQTFYPVFLGLGLLFGPARGLTIGFWLHALLAAGFTYAWLRTANIGRAGAVVGAMAYALGGYMITVFETPFWVGTLGWLPGVLWMTERAIRRRSLASTAAAGLMLGLAGLAGQISFVATFCAFLGLYVLGHVVERSRQQRRFQAWPLVSLGLTAGIGGLVACVQLLPAIEALAESHRAGGVPFLTLPWQQAITLLVPDFYGNPTTTRVYWGAANYAEGTFYAGLITLFLALLAPLTTRRFWAIYLFCLGVAIAYIAFGGPGAPVLAGLPMAKYVNPARTLFLLPLVIGYLAATTLETAQLALPSIFGLAVAVSALAAWAWIGNWGAAQSHAAELRWPLAWAGALLATTVLLLIARGARLRARAQSTWLVAGMVFIDLFSIGSRFNPALPVADLPQPTPAISFLQEQAPPYRVATIQHPGEIVFGPNYLSVFGLSDLGGYSSLLPRLLTELVAAGDPASGGYNANTIWLGSPSLRLLDLLQAGYVVSKVARPDPAPRAEHIGGCAAQTPELTRNQPITAAFAVANFAINRLDLELRVTPGSQPAGSLVVRMWQGTHRARLMLESQADLAQAVDHQRLTFYFASEADAPGHVYEWEVTTANPRTGVALCAEAPGQPSATLYGVDWQPAYQGELNITERLGRLPRAYVVYSAETISDETAAIHRVLDESFDIRNAALVSQSVGLPTHPDLPASPAEILSYGDADIVLRVTAARTGLLVLGDQAYPGWQAWVDGRPAPVLTANVVWRGVLLQPGQHQVEFKFDPLSLKLGLALTAFGLLLAAGLWVIGSRRRPSA
jgi:Bacterial membrane protein YfhO